MKQYDYLVVGAGLFGSVFAHEATACGKKVFVVDKRKHIGGNCYTEDVNDITVHQYGAHIFHTDDKEVWDYMNRFAEFNRFTNTVIARYDGNVYSLPFNMYTFRDVWGINEIEQAKEKIDSEIKVAGIDEPKNLEEQAIKMVGRTIYEMLIKGYTEKQWGKPCTQLPPSIIKRLPVRYEWNNCYFTDRFQGVPHGGYTRIFEQLLEGSTVKLNVKSVDKDSALNKMADRVIYTGCIDEYYGYCFGHLDYRSVRLDFDMYETDSFQGNAVVNYTGKDVPWTRIIEHKFFDPNTNHHGTIVSHEYSEKYNGHNEPCYPINDENNMKIYGKYLKLAKNDKNVIFGGRLGQYKYIDMDTTVREAINLARKLLH